MKSVVIGIILIFTVFQINYLNGEEDINNDVDSCTFTSSDGKWIYNLTQLSDFPLLSHQSLSSRNRTYYVNPCHTMEYYEENWSVTFPDQCKDSYVCIFDDKISGGNDLVDWKDGDDIANGITLAYEDTYNHMKTILKFQCYLPQDAPTYNGDTNQFENYNGNNNNDDDDVEDDDDNHNEDDDDEEDSHDDDCSEEMNHNNNNIQKSVDPFVAYSFISRIDEVSENYTIITIQSPSACPSNRPADPKCLDLEFDSCLAVPSCYCGWCQGKCVAYYETCQNNNREFDCNIPDDEDNTVALFLYSLCIVCFIMSVCVCCLGLYRKLTLPKLDNNNNSNNSNTKYTSVPQDDTTEMNIVPMFLDSNNTTILPHNMSNNNSNQPTQYYYGPQVFFIPQPPNMNNNNNNPFSQLPIQQQYYPTTLNKQ